MDPSRNNMPLQFNRNKNKAPMPVTRSNTDGKDDDMPTSTTHNLIGNSGGGGDMMDQQGNPPTSNTNMLGMCNMMGQMVAPMGGNPNMMVMNPMFGNMQGQPLQGQMQGPLMGPGQMGPGPPGLMGPMPQNMMGPPGPHGMMGTAPPGLLGAGPSGMLGMMDANGQPMMGGHHPHPVAAKEVITLKSCVLYPPPAGAPPRSTREKPAGCKTIFVGGLPENCTEDVLVEIFENCGPIHRVRISKKNFSHIRFENMESVEEALYISGYRLKINDSDTKEDTGRLHIDYADARDDQFEYECLQRAMAREMRHYQKLEEERNRPPSPTPIVRYAEHEAALLVEKMKSDQEFTQASHVLITWMERGECNRRTSTTFYSLVQNVHSQLRRLTNEVQNFNVEYEQYKIQHEHRVQGIIGQICQVERVLASAHKQRNWDHFTKAQRKNIMTWQRQAQELRETHETKSEAEDNVGINDDMDLSDDDDGDNNSTDQLIPTGAKKRKATGGLLDAEPSETDRLKEEKDELKCQVEAFKNEVDMVRLEAQQEAMEKEKQVKALQNALQGMQQQLIAQMSSVTALNEEKDKLEKKLKNLEESSGGKEVVTADKPNGPSTSNNTTITTNDTNTSSMSTTAATTTTTTTTIPTATTKEDISVTSTGFSLSDKEARMVGLISCFLHVHPNGATIDYLWSYLSQMMTTRARDVEDLMEKLPAIFEQKIVGLGATIERKWIFTALRDQTKI